MFLSSRRDGLIFHRDESESNRSRTQLCLDERRKLHFFSCSEHGMRNTLAGQACSIGLSVASQMAVGVKGAYMTQSDILEA